jgi:hypothetical protein
MWHLVTTFHILVTSFPEYVKLVELVMVQVIGSVKDKKCFSILTFMKFKFCNKLTTHLPFVVHMFVQCFYTIHNFPYKECIEQWCRNPTLRQVWGWDSHSQKWELGVLWDSSGLPKLQSSVSEVKTHCLEVFFIPLERSWSVNVENGLAWAIRTSAAQVMVKRRVGSQTGNLTPDH